MTEEETIHLGLLAENLMTDDGFNTLYERVQFDISQLIIATEPQEHERRELLFQTFHAMRAFTTHINSYRTAKDEIVAKRNAEQDTQEDD